MEESFDEATGSLGGRLRPDLVLAVDFIGAALFSILLVDDWLAKQLSQLADSTIILLLKIMPDNTDQIGLLVTWLMLFFVFYRTITRNQIVCNCAIYVCGSAMLALTISDVLKPLFGRPRPELLITKEVFDFQWLRVGEAFASLPSSHAALAFGLAGATSLIWPEYRRVCFSLAVAIAVTRVVIERHYLSDVLIGASVGLFAAIALRVAFSLSGTALQAKSASK